MIFSSNLFLLVFIPIFFLVYYGVPYRLKNFWALAGSAFFYAWGAPLFLFVLIGSVALDFLISKTFHSQNRKFWLWVSLILNIGLLAYFKYANFFVENTNLMLGNFGFEQLEWTAVALPIGISFFTFQKISYLIDVYRGVRPRLKYFHDHLLYIILFPQLIAGPIVRYNEIADELLDRKKEINADNRFLGLFRFVIGLGKKVLIANVLGVEADQVFNADDAEKVNAGTIWYGAICYTFQIYFDFSGYSDMAIGLGRMMGFKFPENFNNPYVSRSITEFWRRWHITLSNWMRDYLYIPLGGNRVKGVRLYVNLWTVFIFSGLWHGASWTFVWWGIYHGFFLVLERLFLRKFYDRLPPIFCTLLTFFIVLLGWVLFRSETLDQALFFVGKMFTGFDGGPRLDVEFWLVITLAFLFSFMAIIPRVEVWQHRFLFERPATLRTLIMIVIILIILPLCIGAISGSGFNPFIYFRF